MLGISQKEFEVLCTKEAQEMIERNIDKEPSTLALKGVSTVICSQIKYLQRCRYKLPHYYAARCIIAPLSYEQSSSLLSSSTKKECGERFLDLTCGLGVDTFHYSSNFKEVITIERDTILAEIAKENFKRLGATNITVINSSCEDYIKLYEGKLFDLIYVDPARRDQTKRVFLLEDCSPNIVELLTRLKEITKKVVIKLSPLFDMEEASRIFGQGVTLRAISVGDECKELCVEIDFLCDKTTIIANCVDKSGNIKEYIFDKEEIAISPRNENETVDNYNYISILDVALRKMRCCTGYYAKYHNDKILLFDNEVALWHTKPDDIAGKIYQINKVAEYKPKQIKEILKKEGIKSATIIKQNFDITLEDIKKRIGVKEGNDAILIFTTIKSTKYLFIVK